MAKGTSVGVAVAVGLGVGEGVGVAVGVEVGVLVGVWVGVAVLVAVGGSNQLNTDLSPEQPLDAPAKHNRSIRQKPVRRLIRSHPSQASPF